MSKLKNIEVEIKFPLYNPEELGKKLNKIAKKKKSEDYQKDTYFIPPHRNFLEVNPIEEWLRLRETKAKSSINYKKWIYGEDKKSTHCEELETKVDDIESLKNILEKLDFKEIIIVEKIRNTWEYNGVEIAIDKVTDLGEFLELEAKGEFSSIDEAKNKLYEVLEELEASVGEQDYLGYPFHMLKKLQK